MLDYDAEGRLVGIDIDHASHFIDDVRGLAGSVYGRRMYEVMRYWDEDHPEWDEAERDYAAAWRSQPKWAEPSENIKSLLTEAHCYASSSGSNSNLSLLQTRTRFTDAAFRR